MTPRDFVNALKRLALDRGVDGWFRSLISPPGKSPDPRLVALGQWFRALGPEDQERVRLIARGSSEATLFGVLCILDGVRAVDDEEGTSQFSLSYKKGERQYQLSPVESEDYLHDILKEE